MNSLQFPASSFFTFYPLRPADLAVAERFVKDGSEYFTPSTLPSRNSIDKTFTKIFKKNFSIPTLLIRVNF